VRNQLQKAMEEGAAPHQYSTWLRHGQQRVLRRHTLTLRRHALTLSPSQRARRGTRCW
jgi:hypothetical protein